MWPWEHLVFGYLLYSLFARLWYRQPPADGPVVALAVATQFPDLVDKPLAWSMGVLPNARSLAHSLFFTAAVLVLVTLLARRLGRPRLAPAVAIGYLSHLAGDVIYSFVWSGGISPGYLLWPLVSVPSRDSPGLVERTVQLLSKFIEVLATPAGGTIFTVELVLIGAVFVLWIVDGWPGLRLPG